MLVKLLIKIKCINFGYWVIVEQYIVQTILVIAVVQYYKIIHTLNEHESLEYKSMIKLFFRSFDLLFINEFFVEFDNFFLFKT